MLIWLVTGITVMQFPGIVEIILSMLPGLCGDFVCLQLSDLPYLPLYYPCHWQSCRYYTDTLPGPHPQLLGKMKSEGWHSLTLRKQ